ncbi:hypothetical protein FOA52_000591 [Chlamydomonas sp. UWO 241]|nr:hypothetical protein FOA52_000591 [Chlamydomonas sp. UWO 241]
MFFLTVAVDCRNHGERAQPAEGGTPAARAVYKDALVSASVCEWCLCGKLKSVGTTICPTFILLVRHLPIMVQLLQSRSMPDQMAQAVDACMASPIGLAMSSAVTGLKARTSSLSARNDGMRKRAYGQGQPRRIVVAPRDPMFAAILPGDSVAEAVITTGLLNFLNLYNAALIGRLVLTWFPSVPEQISSPLATICDPYLNLFRGIIPPIGGTLDLSPILAFVTLNFFTSTAQALPCELAADGKTPVRGSQQAQAHKAGEWQAWMQPSRFQAAWARRQAGAAAIAGSERRSA